MNRQQLLACCGSERWADEMAAAGPFATAREFHQRAAEVWASLDESDWLQAFSKHPKIGERATSEWSAREQKGMEQASSEVTNQTQSLNADYERKFGWIFIVCASGKTGEEMLSMLKDRLSNSPGIEIQIAAAEQAKIMHLRLNKLLAE